MAVYLQALWQSLAHILAQRLIHERCQLQMSPKSLLSRFVERHQKKRPCFKMEVMQNIQSRILWGLQMEGGMGDLWTKMRNIMKSAK